MLECKRDGCGNQPLPEHVRAEKNLVMPLNEMVEGRANSARARRVLGVQELQHGHHKVRGEGDWGRGKRGRV